MNTIPQKLLHHNDNEYDVNIILGENGSGKSLLLNEISREVVKNQNNVIAVATSVHDKFFNYSKYFHFYGGKQGRNKVSKIIKKSLVGKVDEKHDHINSLIKVLNYVGYDSRIGVKVEGFKDNYQSLLKREDKIEDNERYDVISLLNKYKEMFIQGGIVSISLDSFRHGSIQGSALSAIIRNERILKKRKIITNLTIYLEKDGQDIELQNASSGELMILSTLIFISSVISRESVIVIDEPENSLHPKWQREYVSKILDLFYYYKPKIIIATHSALMIPCEQELSDLYIIRNKKIERNIKAISNNEELLSEAFGVVTPENRYLSNHMIDIINNYESNGISFDYASKQVNSYKEKTIDMKQIRLLDGILTILKQLKETKG